MTNQEFFNETIRLLRAQGKPGYDHTRGMCTYLSRDRSRCAIGLHLSLEEMKKRQPFGSVGYLYTTHPELFKNLQGVSLEFMSNVQRAHDNAVARTKGQNFEVFMEMFVHILQTLNENTNLSIVYY